MGILYHMGQRAPTHEVGYKWRGIIAFGVESGLKIGLRNKANVALPGGARVEAWTIVMARSFQLLASW